MAGRRDIEAGSAYVRLYMEQTAFQRGLKDMQRSLKAAGAKFTAMGRTATLAGGAIVGAIAGAAVSFAKFGDTLDKMSKRTGVSVESLSELKFAAEQSGASIDDLGGIIQKMNRRVGRVTAGVGSSVETEALEKLGVSIEDLSKMNPEERFLAIADAMANYGDDAAAAGLAQRAFGTGVDQLLPLIFAGRDGIEALREEARALGITMSTEDAEAAAVFTDALNRLKVAAGAAWMKIGAAAAPVLTDLADRMVKFAVDATEWISKNEEMVVIALKVGAVVGTVGVALITFGSILSNTAILVHALNAAFLFLAANPIVAIIMAVTAAIMAAAAAVVYYTAKTADLSNTMETVRQKADEMREADLALMDELQSLADQQSRTNDEMDRARAIADTLEGRYGNLGITIDGTTGKIEGMTGAQKKLTEAMRRGALAQLRAERMQSAANIKELEREQASTYSQAMVGVGLRSADTLSNQIQAERANRDALFLRMEAIRAGDQDAITGAGPAAPAAPATPAAPRVGEGLFTPTTAGPLGPRLGGGLGGLDPFGQTDAAATAANIKDYFSGLFGPGDEMKDMAQVAQAVGPSGTFSSAAAMAMSGGKMGPAERTAKSSEAMVKILGVLTGLGEDNINALKEAFNFS